MEHLAVLSSTLPTFLQRVLQGHCSGWWGCSLFLASSFAVNCPRVSSGCSAQDCCRSSSLIYSSALSDAASSATRRILPGFFQARHSRRLLIIGDRACARVSQPSGAGFWGGGGGRGCVCFCCEGGRGPRQQSHPVGGWGGVGVGGFVPPPTPPPPPAPDGCD